MEPNELLKSLASNPDVRRLAEAITKRKSNVVVDGLQGSSAALYFAAILRSMAKDEGKKDTVLFVLDDQEDAGYFYHDLTQMLGDKDVVFFPSSYRRAIKYNQKDDANELLRTNTLTKVLQPSLSEENSQLIIVTYPDALAERVVSRQNVEQHSIVLSKGGSIDVTELETQLFDLGFTRTDYVYEPGQFAIRGSIVDVFSFSNEDPYRIDFFGDEVDSIRTFDIVSQLSGEKLDSVTIVPDLLETQSEYISLLSFLPEDTLLVARNLDFVADKIGEICKAGFSRQAETENRLAVSGNRLTENTRELDAGFLSSREEFEKEVAGLRKVQIGKMAKGEGQRDLQVSFNTGTQPLFHKNFELVTNEFERLIGEGYSINIFADNEKQIRRLEDIFDANRKGDTLITFTPVPTAIHEGFIDHTTKQCYFTDHQLFDRYHKYSLKSDKARRGKVALTLKEIQQFEVGDYVVHIDHGVGKFGGLVRVPTNGAMQEMIKILYQNDDIVYVSIHALNKVSKYKGKEGEAPRLNRLGTGAWERMKERVKKKVKDIARDLIRLYSQRMQEDGFAFSPDSYMQHELEASFIYEDTPDQFKATQDVKTDMEKRQPMDRLVCGDVGFGKTEVAVRAAFKAAADSKQVAVLVPTTILAYQHYQTFKERLKDFPVRVEYISRARSAKQTKEVLDDLKEGKVDIIIGTHKLIGKDVKFKDLGLLVIDEEQKFGVSVKEKLRQMKINVDTLTMTATPIPRTLQFSLMGARDLSIIQTPPPNRYPIQTEIHTFSPEIIAEAINFEMSRNGQVFFVNNKISNLEELKALIQKHVPDARVCVGHGRMNPQELEEVVFDFMNYDYDVMLSTTIVENGIDIPNANTIIINGAQNYGLSDLHQMRGRVGRSNKKAFCYLLAPPLAALNDDSRRRLQALENFSGLGSGMQIALQDLDIRGAGNLLGAEQSGFIADLGYEAYQKVLAEAMDELKHEMSQHPATDGQGDVEPVYVNVPFVTEASVESDLVAHFPETFVPSSGERITLYRELDSITSYEQLESFRLRLIDRFGQIPEEGEELLKVMPLKWLAASAGVEKVTLKSGNMILYLVGDFASSYYESEEFSRIIDYASLHPRDTKMREHDGRRSLWIKSVTSVSQAVTILQEINKKC
ncbi:MAG: transcription-repair coupling factor [Bacteroidaceae bacterium]|nr:transcription-repair coupling factor [Bacteroidaceae bacterium]